MASLWENVFNKKMSKTIKKEYMNDLEIIMENLKNFDFPTMVPTFEIEPKDLGDLNSFLATKRAQFIYIIRNKQEDTLNDDAVELAKKIKLKNLEYIYPVFDNAEAYYKDDAKNNHLKLAGAVASTGSRWDFATTTGTIHGKVFNDVLPVNVTQSTFTRLINSGCAMYTNRKGASFFTESEEGKFFDFWHNCYWLINELQMTNFNLIYTVPNKIPYNSNGVNIIKSILTYVLDRGVANGSIGPHDYKTKTGLPQNGATILAGIRSNGYYIETNPINSEEAIKRIAPITNIYFHVLGAIHKSIIGLSIFR